MKISKESKIYLIGILALAVTLFILTGVVFLCLVADKLDIVMSQPAGITFTYFIQIMDRFLIFIGLFGILPLTLYQLTSKNKTKLDKGTSVLAILIAFACIIAFAGGEYRFFQKYRDGELRYSPMFCNTSIELQIFNLILKEKGIEAPLMCVPPTEEIPRPIQVENFQKIK